MKTAAASGVAAPLIVSALGAGGLAYLLFAMPRAIERFAADGRALPVATRLLITVFDRFQMFPLLFGFGLLPTFLVFALCFGRVSGKIVWMSALIPPAFCMLIILGLFPA